MPRGKPPKSAEQHKADGTYRADRHAALEGPPPPPALDLAAPQSVVDAGLAGTWDVVIADLSAMGTLCRTDLDRITQAFECRNNARKVQQVYDTALSECDVSHISKLQSAHASAVKVADSLIAAVERSVMLRRKPKAGDYLSRMGAGAGQ